MDRKQKMDKITQMLKEGVENVFSSENYKVFLKTMGQFHRYSLRNQLLIWQQTNGTATLCAGYKKWQTMGRQVRKGEHGLLIYSPMIFKKKSDDPSQEDETITLFKATSVFDISQTDGEELPSLVQELTDDDESYDAIIDRLIDFSSVPVIFTDDLPYGVYGSFSPSEQRIRVRDSVSRHQKLKTLVHELSHYLCDNDKDHRDSRETMEVRAESISFCVLSQIPGVEPSDSYSFPYIAGWSSTKELPELMSVMQDIRDVSDKILSAIMPQEVAA